MQARKVETTLSALLLILFIAHFSVVFRYGTNLPVGDEWDQMPGWERTLSWDWVFKSHNEHRIVPTKLQTWLLTQWTEADNRVQQQSNFLLFGLLLLALVAFFRKLVPEFPKAWLLAFVIFFLSTANWENHLWAFQSQFHFAFLFLILACLALFAGSGVKHVLLGSAFALAAMYSFSAGALGAFGLAVSFPVFRAVENRTRGISLLQSMIFSGLVLIGGVFWFLGNPAAAGHVPRTSLLSWATWAFFLNVLSLGFGVDGKQTFLGAILLLVVIAPLMLLLKRYRQLPSNTRSSVWAVGTLTLIVLVILLVVAQGRAVLGLGMSKSSRYNEIAILLVPLCAAAWSLLLSAQWRNRALAILWSLLFVSYSDNWTLRPYRQTAQLRREGRECMERYYTEGGKGECPLLHPSPLAARFDRARELGLSFTKSQEKMPR